MKECCVKTLIYVTFSLKAAADKKLDAPQLDEVFLCSLVINCGVTCLSFLKKPLYLSICITFITIFTTSVLSSKPASLMVWWCISAYGQLAHLDRLHRY